jgi:hypothetical protein
MKLRIKGNSLRLRISQSEMVRLLREGRIAETIQFAPDALWTYALRHEATADATIRLEYSAPEVTVVLSTAAARHWAAGDGVGIYGESEMGVALLVEKDFTCLDGDDAVDEDAFPNPKAGVVC